MQRCFWTILIGIPKHPLSFFEPPIQHHPINTKHRDMLLPFQLQPKHDSFMTFRHSPLAFFHQIRYNIAGEKTALRC